MCCKKSVRSFAGLLCILFCAPAMASAQEFGETAATQEVDHPVDGIIVRYRTIQVGAALNARVRAAQAAAMQRGVGITYFRGGALGIHVLRLDQKMAAADVDELAKQIAASDPNVEYAEADRIMQHAFTPNDPRYNEQWHYFESTGGINVPPAWDLFRGANVVVAVIDTGHLHHVDLAANLIPGYDFISDIFSANDGNGRDADTYDWGDQVEAGACANGAPGRIRSSWHGTHVAGTVAARTNNSTGVAGVAFDARILPARVLGRCGGATSDIADAIVWSSGGSVSGVPAGNRAHVLNLSLGGPGACSSTFQNAINSARSRNATVVVAAGNSNVNAANTQPANCSGVVTVAATNRSGARASYSNFGATVEIAAPGGQISNSATTLVLSTSNSGLTFPETDNYEFKEGTSMAAPHVAGVVALMLSKNGSRTPDQILAHLQSTARPFPGACSQCGSGIVNALAAVNAVPDPGPPPPAPSTPTNLRPNNVIVNGGNYTVAWDASTGSVNHYTLHEVRALGPPPVPATTDYIVVAPMTSKSFSKGAYENEYTYTVRACSTADESACSAWSGPVHIGTCPSGGCTN